MGFGWSQGKVAAGSTTTTTATLTSTPGVGDLIIVSIEYGNPIGYPPYNLQITVADGNGNNYIQTPSSPTGYNPAIGNAYLFYLIAPANVNKAITATCNDANTSFLDVFVNDFTVSGGVVRFDCDLAGGGSNTSSTSITGPPSITPAQAGGLLINCTSDIHTLTAPTQGATLGAWTGGPVSGSVCNTEYVLSGASGATSIAYTSSVTNDSWVTVMASFLIVPESGGIQVP